MNKTYKFPYVQQKTIGRVTNMIEAPLVIPNGNKLFTLSGTPESQKQQPRFFSPISTGERTS